MVAVETVSQVELKKSINDIVEVEQASEVGYVQPVTALAILASLSMSLQSLNYGIAVGMPNNTADAMLWTGVGETFPGEPATFDPPITQNQFNWVLSLFAIGGIIGGSFGGELVNRVGPKMASLINDVIYIISGLILGFAQNVAMLIAGRIILGVAVGGSCCIIPIYNNDISATQIRGATGVFHQLFITIGILLISVVGMKSLCGTPDLWPVVWSFHAIISVVHILMMFFMPESPKYLLDLGKEEQAEKALKFLRGADYDVTAELADLVAQKEASEKEGQLSVGEQFKILFSKSYIKQITIGVVLMIGQQFSGINAVMFYSTSIFAGAGMTNAELATILMTAFNVLTTFPSIPIIEKYGRKVLLVGGFGGQGLMHVLFVVALIFEWQWPSVVFVLLGVGFFAVGPGPVPWMMTAELLPAKITTAGVSLAVGVNWICVFIVGQVYPYMNDGLNEYSFLPFAAFCFFTVGFTLLLVPETKGKSFREIESLFNNES